MLQSFDRSTLSPRAATAAVSAATARSLGLWRILPDRHKAGLPQRLLCVHNALLISGQVAGAAAAAAAGALCVVTPENTDHLKYAVLDPKRSLHLVAVTPTIMMHHSTVCPQLVCPRTRLCLPASSL